MAEVTRRSVLLECLEYERGLWKLCSKKYDTLEPKEGMEDKWDEQKEKCKLLEDMIQAYESEPVKAAMAGWQNMVMKRGGPPERIEI